MTFSPEAGTWAVTHRSLFTDDNSGVIFSITAGGQVQYVSDTLAGPNYSGTIRISQITEILQAGTSNQFVIPNNQIAEIDLTGLIFASAETKGFRFLYDIQRSTDTFEETVTGEAFGSFKPKANTWVITSSFNFRDDNAGVIFTIGALDGQLKITSDDITGPNYIGTLRVTDIIKIEK